MADLIDIHIGRQPILNADLELYAYELLFRSHTDNHCHTDEADRATAQVMINTFGDMGLKDIAGDRKVFINFTESLLLREQMPFFPPRQVVVEVLEDVKISPALLRSLNDWRNNGFCIALDDYVFNPQLQELESYADIIKVDILEVGPKQLSEHAQRLKHQGVRLLAEKVETRAQFEFCRKIGFDYFQGYFFAKPKVIKGKRLPTNKLTIVQLLANVYDPDVDIQMLSNIIANDVALSQKLLKFLAEHIPCPYPITSVKDGVMRFGLNRLQSWVSMLALAGLDDKPMELFRMALTRAKFCELVGEHLGDYNKDIYFTVGLFSTLDAIMDLPLGELLNKLKLDQNIVKALTEASQSNLYLSLNAVKNLEVGGTEFTTPGGISPTLLSKYYLQAMQFAQSAFSQP